MKKKSKSSQKKLQIEPVPPTIVEKPKIEEVIPVEIKKIADSSDNKKIADSSDKFKLLAVVLLFGVLIYFVYHFYFQNQQFSGPEITQDSFKEIFSSAQNVYIVMDVRGANNSNSILQCGVDFAASSGMGGKTVVPLSFSDDGCVSPNGYIPFANCSAMLKNGITVYVKAGNSQVKYYKDGMVVSVGSNYTLGVCGIKVLPVPIPQESSNSTETS